MAVRASFLGGDGVVDLCGVPCWLELGAPSSDCSETRWRRRQPPASGQVAWSPPRCPSHPCSACASATPAATGPRRGHTHDNRRCRRRKSLCRRKGNKFLGRHRIAHRAREVRTCARPRGIENYIFGPWEFRRGLGPRRAYELHERAHGEGAVLLLAAAAALVQGDRGLVVRAPARARLRRRGDAGHVDGDQVLLLDAEELPALYGANLAAGEEGPDTLLRSTLSGAIWRP